jgi:hypothetical protein
VAALEPAPHQPDYPLSHAQQRIWLDHRAERSSLYNIVELFHFRDPLDSEIVRASVAALIRRHEILRTAFVLRCGEPRQCVLAEVEAEVEVVEMSAGLDDTALQARVRGLADRPFDLERPPLLRALLIRRVGDGSLLVLVMQHIIADGWSLNLIERELAETYAALRDGRALAPSRTLQYRDFAVWEGTQRLDDHERYWLAQMDGAPTAVALPGDARPEHLGFKSRAETRVLPPELRDALIALATRQRSSLANVILALFHLLLFRLSGQKDLVVGMVAANRPHPDLEEMIGVFVNIVPVRSRPSEEMDFEQLLDQVTAAAYGALDHQAYPFDLLVRHFTRVGAGRIMPFADVLYVYQLRPPGWSVTDWAAHERHDSLGSVKATLCLMAMDDPVCGLTLTLHADRNRFESARIAAFLDTLATFAVEATENVQGGARI